jgi:hypothetical protein
MRSLVGILNAPEVVHHGRNAGQEAYYGGRTQCRLHAQQNASAPDHQHDTSDADGPLGHGNFLRARILREHIAFFKVIDPAVKEISAEQ